MSRAPLNISREMKLLLLLLLMVALIGLWYVWTGNRAAEQAGGAVTPPVTAGATDPSQGGTTTIPGAPGSGTDPAGSNPADPNPTDPNTTITVRPKGPVAVGVIPSFPGAPNPTTVNPVPGSGRPATPDGINPTGELAGVPGNNPFRPLSVTESGSAGEPGSTVPPSNPSNTTAGSGGESGTASGATATLPPPGNDLGLNGGVLPITPVPGTPPASGIVNGLPQIPGGNGATSVDSPNTTVTPPSTGAAQGTGTANTPATVTVTPLPRGNVPVQVGQTTGNSTGTGGNSSGGIGGSSASNGTPTPAPAPIAPPIAGVTTPRPGTLTLPLPGSAGIGGTGTGATASAFPRPGAAQAPQVITELGGAGGNSSLDAIISNQNLEFNAVVLGPVNTAIFKGRGGFVVVSVGQTLPDTNVTLQAVRADSVTLTLGSETKTLELEKR